MTFAHQTSPRILAGIVVANQPLCRDHYRLTFELPEFAPARPGQFVHLCPASNVIADFAKVPGASRARQAHGVVDYAMPMLRRAFSISGLRRGRHVEIDVIYRVVGRATRWMRTLRSGNELSVMGPQGNDFPIRPHKPGAWMVAGGVGLPPMLWLAEALCAAGKSAVAFCGAQTADLLPLQGTQGVRPDPTARTAVFWAGEFNRAHTPVVISTDDGSLGFHGHIGSALLAHLVGAAPKESELVVYTCGPERMMRFVAQVCLERGIECHVCMERNMACGTGLCQSCVVPVHDTTDAEGWRYRLCCTEGPVFAAQEILWA